MWSAEKCSGERTSLRSGQQQEKKLACVGLLCQQLLQLMQELIVGEALVGRDQAQQAALPRGEQAGAFSSCERGR